METDVGCNEIVHTLKLGVDEEKVNSVGNVLGSWAASVCLSSLIYPFTLFGGTYMAKYIGKRYHI